MAERQLPKVSFILPTLNAAALLDNCLAAIARQTYPRDRYEIVIADAGSKDATREIARRHGAIVLDDPGHNMEEGKRLALAHATGDYIVFVDADNELTHPDYLALAVDALARNPQALGVEAYYPPSPKMSSFCAYLTHVLQVGDPIVWLMSVKPVRVAVEGEVERWTLPPDTMAYPLGANGFVFRRTDLESVRAKEQFQDTHIAMHLMQAGRREWLRLRGRGVHHYYVQTLGGFLHKRRRAMVHYLDVRSRTRMSWMKSRPPVPGWLACLYGLTIIGPLWHTVAGLARSGDARWLWHAPASFVSVLGILWGLQTYLTRGKKEKRLVAALQPRQSLKDLPSSNAPPRKAPRLVCFVNGIYSSQLGGGDIYFSHIARAAREAGFELHFFGGHAFKEYLAKQNLPPNLTLTDRRAGGFGSVNTPGEQCRLLFDFARRLLGTLRRLGEVRPDDCAYAMSDYWFDAIPLALCRARAKVMYLGMLAPTLREVLFRRRADVTGSRLASFYYWASQQLSWRLFRRCRRRHATYSHPDMKEFLLRLGFHESEVTLVANGMDVAAADRTPAQPKQFDVVWTGRVHPQKGIDDLLATLVRLSQRIEGFRAVIIGNSRGVLEPKVKELGIGENVTFVGVVSEEEKFRLLKASRVFVMPSRYESWGIVVGEALASGVPVVAYELACYRPVFGEFVRYVKCFDREAFAQAVEREVNTMRGGRNYLDGMDLAGLKQRLSWAAAQAAFAGVLRKMADQPRTESRL